MTPDMIAECIGCGCDDTRRCEVDGEGNGCSWLRVDYEEGLGVCSSCPEYEAAWDAGNRSLDYEALPEEERLLLPGEVEFDQTLSYLRDRRVPR